MEKINYDIAKKIVMDIKSIDKYYKELNMLKSDVEFFNLFMRREKKSKFEFTVKVGCGSSNKAFEGLWKRYGFSSSYLENVYVEFELIKMLINQIYDETGPLEEDKIPDLIYYFEQYDDLNVEDYVGDFIGCSRGICDVIENIKKLRKTVE